MRVADFRVASPTMLFFPLAWRHPEHGVESQLLIHLLVFYSTDSSDDALAHSRWRELAAFKRRRRGELIEEYHAAGLGAEAIVAPHERFSHPQLRATGGVVDVQDPEVGNMTQLGVPLYLQGTPGAVQGPQPLPGAHTDEILESLGRTPADVEQLRRRGVV